MNEIKLDLRFTLAFETAVLVSSGSGGGRFHRMAVRDGRDRLIVPATTLKGRLRFHAERFAGLIGDPEDATVTRLFGSEDAPGALFFDDARLIETFREGKGTLYRERRTGIKIDCRTGSVVDKALHFYEAAPRGLVFSARIEGWLPPGPDGDAAVATLLGALHLLEELGSGKTRGLGRVTAVVEALVLIEGGRVIEHDRAGAAQRLEAYVRGQMTEVS